ncbi:hypothetical protein C2845_PM17G04950 [Panicum miliaceum]|uniref:Uncharacterized protein n=1 Tax=Panicum miliaceum TaxID=4540 RepID=A0A3L6Q5Y7_PANMI|nr:hypothetical protein C2845_PM17G04950 [Panicum miliaceum]
MAAVVLILLLQLRGPCRSFRARSDRKGGIVDDHPAALPAELERWPGRRYAVIFDAGSTGSRVHIFKFNRIMDLVPMDGEIQVFANDISATGSNPPVVPAGPGALPHRRSPLAI